MTKFSCLPDKTQAHLANISQAVTGILPKETMKWKIETKTLKAGSATPVVIGKVKKWHENGCLYLYTVNIVTEKITSSVIINTFNTAKSAKKGGRAFARLNNPSKCMYVGSSKKIYQRLKEHLGFGSKGTYSLQLAYWANQIPLELEFECAKYFSTIDPEAMQAMEDTLWSEHQPMFGRKGAR